MPRRSRIVLPGIPHHVVQRASKRAQIFFSEEDYIIYLRLLERYVCRRKTLILSYCIMPNHVHLIAVPSDMEDLSYVIGATHRSYALMKNAQHGWSGHLWQERYYSSPLDEPYFWTALRYVEQNPVKAGIVNAPWHYRWSSAAFHCGLRHDRLITSDTTWRNKLSTVSNWKKWLKEDAETAQVDKIRTCTARDYPTGSDIFLKRVEQALQKRIVPRPPGRPRINVEQE